MYNSHSAQKYDGNTEYNPSSPGKVDYHTEEYHSGSRKEEEDDIKYERMEEEATIVDKFEEEEKKKDDNQVLAEAIEKEVLPLKRKKTTVDEVIERLLAEEF